MLPIPLRTIVSEVEIQNSIVKNFKQYRTLNQTAPYVGAGAEYYYDPDMKFSGESYDYPKITTLLESVFTEKKGAKIAVVSLACGNCKKDRRVLEPLQAAGYPFSFFGVDSSMAMLYKAGEVLNDVTFKARLICADVGAFNFKKELDRIMGEYDVVIYMFFGNTFIGNILGNLNQTYMTDLLNNILRPGDYMLLDLVGFKTLTPTIREKLLERYTGYLTRAPEIKFFLNPLKFLGVSENFGELTLKMAKDDTTQAHIFIFGFKIHTPFRFTLEGDELIVNSNECINLYYIWAYDLYKLTEFLASRNFKLKEQRVGEFVSQLLFKRQ